MLLQAQTGPQTLTDGTYPNFRAGKLGDVIISELNGRYYENVYRGNVFVGSYTAAALAAPSATAIGAFGLYNPIGSGKNLVILEISTALTTFTAVATTVCAIGAYSFTNQTPTATTPGNTPFSALIGSGNTSIAKTYTAATIVAGNTVAIRNVANVGVMTAVGFGSVLFKDEVAGALVVAPGSGFGLAATATAADDTVQVVYTWAELPI